MKPTHQLSSKLAMHHETAARRIRKGPGSGAGHPPLEAGPCAGCMALEAGPRKGRRTETTEPESSLTEVLRTSERQVVSRSP
jgi:hypothetical protein